MSTTVTVGEKTEQQLFEAGIPPFWGEALQSWIRYRCEDLILMELPESEISLLGEYAEIVRQHHLRGSIEWQVAITIYLVRYHQRMKEKELFTANMSEADRINWVSRIALFEADRVAKWYSTRLGFTFRPDRRLEQIQDRLMELAAAVDTAHGLADSD